MSDDGVSLTARRRAALRKGAKRSAAARQCFKCKRKSAIVTVRYVGGWTKHCRWCGYECGGLT